MNAGGGRPSLSQGHQQPKTAFVQQKRPKRARGDPDAGQVQARALKHIQNVIHPGKKNVRLISRGCRPDQYSVSSSGSQGISVGAGSQVCPRERLIETTPCTEALPPSRTVSHEGAPLGRPAPPWLVTQRTTAGKIFCFCSRKDGWETIRTRIALNKCLGVLLSVRLSRSTLVDVLHRCSGGPLSGGFVSDYNIRSWKARRE